MNILVEFSLKKKSETENLNQDAYQIGTNGTFAIADGVSSAPFSEIWSDKIVKKFVKTPPILAKLDSKSISLWLEDIRKSWMSEIKKNDSVDEFIMEIAENDGAATTFLGGVLEKKSKKRKKLHVWATGDTNLFILRKNKIKESFPIDSTKKFSDRTHAISSIAKADVNESFTTKEFDLKKYDIVILATDALANWIMKSSNLGQKPWKRILNNKSHEKIESFIDHLRIRNEIDDDDTTCVIFQI